MRIHSITLRNYRGVTDRTVEFDDHVTVVEGPNEIGKSSIAEALRLLRTMKHSTTARRVKAVQTVGVHAGPEVESTISTGPYRLTYRKRWLRSTMAELDVAEPRVEQLTGDEAHERYLQILDETVDADLLDALEVQQGESLRQASLARLASLQRALADSDTDQTDDALLAHIEAEFRRYHTATGLPTGEYAQIAKRVTDVEEQVSDLEARSAEMQRFTEDHASWLQREQDAQKRHAAAQRELLELQASKKELERLTEAERTAAATLDVARREAERAQSAWQARVSARDGIAEQTSQVQETAGRARDLEAEYRAAVKVTAEARKAHDQAQRQAEEASSAVKRSQRLLRDITARSERHELADRIERIKLAEQAEREAAATLTIVRVTDDDVESLRKLETEHAVAVAARDAAAPVVTVRRLGELPVRVSGEHMADAEEHVHVHDPVHVEVEGVVSIDVRPGAQPQDVLDHVETAKRALDEAYARLDVPDLAAARAQAVRRREAELNRARAADALVSLLDGQSRESLETTLAELSAQDVDGAELPTKAEATRQLDEAETLETTALAGVAEAQQPLERAVAAEEASREAWQEAVQQLNTSQALLDDAVDRLTSDRASMADEAVEQEATRTAAVVEESEATLAQARAALAELDQASLQMHLDNAEQGVASAQAQRQEAVAQVHRLEGLLEDRTREGIYDKHTALLAEAESLRTQRARLERQAKAARLLFETMTKHRDIAQARYVAPFKHGIEQLGRVVYGSDFAVEIDMDLRIVARILDGRRVEFEQLSGGAQEQLALLGRLAAAQLVDESEGAPLILDDALGFSDPERLAQLAVVLNTVGSRAQIILLTCQPNRYDRLGRAKRVTLS